MVSTDRLIRLHGEHGQSPWLDNLKRSLISSGELVKVRESGIRGLTSNPTIFQKAIQGSVDYDEQFQTLIRQGSSIIDSYWAMVLEDIHGALDVFAPVYDSSAGTDGFVSVEVDPNLAIEHISYLVDGARTASEKIRACSTAIGIWTTSQSEQTGSSDQDNFKPLPRPFLNSIQSIVKSPDISEETFYEYGKFLARVDADEFKNSAEYKSKVEGISISEKQIRS